MSVSRFPLTWPTGWKRIAPGARIGSSFSKRRSQTGGGYPYKQDLSVADALSRLFHELRRLHVGEGDVIVSTNIRTRLDGLPYSNEREPSDPGVAVYFRLKKDDRVLACDRYTKVAGNIAAIAAHIEALRAIERYGVGTLNQAFAGYAALPPSPSHDWAIVLGVRSTDPLDVIEAAYRRLAAEAHPDRGGSHEQMARINAARDAARKVTS